VLFEDAGTSYFSKLVLYGDLTASSNIVAQFPPRLNLKD
jgi:hypothetical protein